MAEKLFAFDLDGTLMPGALAERAYVELRARGALSISDEEHAEIDSFLPTDYNEYVRRAVRGLNNGVKGVHIDYLGEIARSMMEKDVTTLYEEMSDEIQFAKKIGAKVAVISASPKLFVDELARALGADYSDGALWQVRDNIVNPDEDQHNTHFDKGERLLAACKMLGAVPYAAFGDTRNDIPMFSLSSRAVAVNPKPDLRIMATDNGWEIIDCVGHTTR